MREEAVLQLNFCELPINYCSGFVFIKDFFIQDINAGFKDETDIPEQLVPISSLSEEQLENLIKKLRKASEGLNSTLEDHILSHPALHDALNDPKNGDCATKHLKQQMLKKFTSS
ncbi:tRNA:m(4)X modification enzyme TRM13 homolog [Nannospalax galili]|uniref:tRNA:m(4)X modification enzyme TRM13 homolog n=1 Tax=Nannospalax galili TaxID=1026970 RepID=UPI00111C3B81|nr:tRNA:m(4)X modification enzyme TRM13 homolog [Nannospalax galili]